MRPSKDVYFLRHAVIASQMSTCIRRAVGAVVVNARRQILGIGYNGVPSGLPHCNEGNPCPGANAPSGTKLSDCYATHAEVNAVLQCRDPYAIDAVYVTTSPCVDCTKYLLNTSARRIVFIQEYPQPAARAFWELAGREWVHAPEGARGGWSEEVGKPAFPFELWKTMSKFDHAPECLFGMLGGGDCSCGLARRQERKPDPNCPRCGGKGEISVGGGCMGYDDETCSCVK